ncbi:MAG: transporter substrate-binding domain-containing protein [Gammaproteobacteria bacterium]|nr:transporter substrate-binding domain-containing protein [Gammaproteobacteria bacterium]
MNVHHKIDFTFPDSIFKSFFIPFFIPFFILFSHPALSQQTIVLNTAFGSPVSNESQTGFADQVVAEAFRRIGYQLETVRLPAERALINANRGIDDGDLIRVAGLQKKYPNLIQVPEAVMVIDMVLFSKNKPGFVVNGWESVASHSLAIISGWKIMEKNFSVLGDRVEIIKTDNAEQSFTLLAKDRVDFIAYSKWSGLGYLKAHNITDVTLLDPPLASPGFYVYLHKKHNKIVPQLAAAIRKMKTDGTLQAISDRLLKPYLQKKE